MIDPALLETIERVRRGVASTKETEQICDLLIQLLEGLYQ